MSGKIESAEAWFVDPRRAIKQLGRRGAARRAAADFFAAGNGTPAAIWREDKYGTD